MTDLQGVIVAPKNTLWNGHKIKKDVFLLPETLASQLTIYPTDNY